MVKFVVKCVVKCVVKLKNCLIGTKFGVVVDMDPVIMINTGQIQGARRAPMPSAGARTRGP